MSGEVRLIAQFTARHGAEEEVERLLLWLTNQVRLEPGCLEFTPHRAVRSPAVGVESSVDAPVGRRFVVTERYRDEAAFAAHLAAPYGAEFNRALGLHIEESGSQLTFLGVCE